MATTTQTANDAFYASQTQVLQRLYAIQLLVADMGPQHAENPESWGLVSDMNLLSEQLGHIVEGREL